MDNNGNIVNNNIPVNNDVIQVNGIPVVPIQQMDQQPVQQVVTQPVQQVPVQTQVVQTQAIQPQVVNTQVVQTHAVQQVPVNTQVVQQPVQQVVTQPQQTTADVVKSMNDLANDNIPGLPQNNQTETTLVADAPEKKDNKKLTIIIALILFLIAAVVILYFTGFFDVMLGKDSGGSNTPPAASKATINFVKLDDGSYDAQKNNISGNLLGTYNCKNDDCIIDNFTSYNLTYAVIYDGEYILYNFETKEVQNTGIVGYGNKNENGNTSYLAVDYNYDLKGFLTTCNEDGNLKSAFYSVSRKKASYKSSVWLPYKESVNPTLVGNGFIALKVDSEEGVKTKLIKYDSGTDVSGTETDGFYTEIYDSINDKTYMAIVDTLDANKKFKLLNQENLPINDKFLYLGINTKNNNIVYLTSDTTTYYACDLAAYTCDVKTSQYKVLDVVDEYLIVQDANKIYVVDNGTLYEAVTLQGNMELDRNNTTLYKYEDGEGQSGLHLFIKNKDEADACGDFYFDATLKNVGIVGNYCQ